MKVPLHFTEVVGHERAKQALRRAVRSGQPAHAYLITGAPSVGKYSLAYAFAAALACTEPTAEGEACGQCKSCWRALQETHPEIVVIHPYSEQTLIWQLWEGHNAPREAKAHQEGVVGRTLPFAPSFGRRLVYLFSRAETLTEAAANSLLKTLEEPPSYAVFLLLAPALEEVLETIRSRCQWVPLHPVSAEEIERWLVEQHGVEETVARRCATLSQGAPGRAWSLATQPEVLCWWDAVADLSYDVGVRRPKWAALQLAEQLRQLAGTLEETSGGRVKSGGRSALLVAMEAMSSWFRDALWLGIVGVSDSLTYPGEEARLHETARSLGTEGLIRAIETICEVYRAVEGNANLQLATEVLMLRLLSLPKRV